MSDEETMEFIRLVEERPVLWNRKNYNYKNSNKQLDAWIEISQVMNIPRSCLIQKWKSLCGSFRKYHSKWAQSNQTGSCEYSIKKGKQDNYHQ